MTTLTGFDSVQANNKNDIAAAKPVSLGAVALTWDGEGTSEATKQGSGMPIVFHTCTVILILSCYAMQATG